MTKVMAMLRLCLLFPCAAVFLASWVGDASAQQPGFSQIEIHDPFSPRYVPMTPLRGTFRTFATGTVNGPTYTFSSSPSYPFCPWYGGYPPWPGRYYGPAYYGGFVPPLWLPDGPLYGPQAVQRFLGIDNPLPNDGAFASAPPVQGGFGVLAPAAGPAQADKKPRATNADARARSQRFLVLGDGYFAKQAYSDAYQRYKLAAQAAPDMPDGFLRQGLALVALGRYDAAARTLKRGLALDPHWADSGFRLDELYIDNGIAKAAHLEALAQEAKKAPSADVIFLLGVMLYFDGQGEQARPCFVRARELAGGDDGHLDGFLRQLAPPADELPAPAAAAGQPRARPVAKQATDPRLVPQATAVAPFSKIPAARTAPVPRPLAPGIALPRPLAPSAGAADKPARDL